jgi:hypothetical protein
MNEISAFMVLSLMTHSRVPLDERMYGYPRETLRRPGDGTRAHQVRHSPESPSVPELDSPPVAKEGASLSIGV